MITAEGEEETPEGKNYGETETKWRNQKRREEFDEAR